MADRCYVGPQLECVRAQLLLRLEGAEAARHAVEESLRSVSAKAERLEADARTLQVRGSVKQMARARVSDILQHALVAMACSCPILQHH